MLFFYVRHGDPIYAPDSLTEQGYAQAEALVERMKICKPEIIFSSSSNRAILTAQPTAKYFGLDIQVLDWCNENLVWNEFASVDSDGRHTWFFSDADIVEVFNTEEVYNLSDDWWKHPKFIGTAAKSGLDRINRETDAFMKNLGYIREGKGFIAENPKFDRVALFAHQGFGMAFLSSLLKIPYPMFSTHFDIGHSALTVIHFADNGFTVPKVLQLSNDSHIFHSDKLVTKYQNNIEF